MLTPVSKNEAKMAAIEAVLGINLSPLHERVFSRGQRFSHHLALIIDRASEGTENDSRESLI